VNRSPILGAHQAHEVRGRDRIATCIAGLADIVAAPKLNHVVARETAISEALSNLLANELGSHSMPKFSASASSINTELVIGNLDERPE